ncbi:sorting nexin-29 isoform X1 [Paroedura picta]|uniref:sorting nexin-29 isoform X1 n=1 Tax=Paroedura picta TaxID=143630 RepID=UPI0040566793
MSGPQNNVDRRQFLLQRLLDAVKQCQIRFGGRKEIASDSDSRVTCLCAQFESVLQHGLKRTRGLALTAAAIKQAAGFSSKTEMDPVFWYYVKEILNRHELQRFYSLKNITTDVGRGRAWLRCALNEHSLERYFHMLLADKDRLSVFYEDWSFMMDEERSSMIPTMAAGLNPILFAINIDNKDLNGQSKGASAVSHLLKESTQNVTSLLKGSTQGVSSLLREITASSPVSILIRSDQDTDLSPVFPKSASGDLHYGNGGRRRRKVNIISFDDHEDEPDLGDLLGVTVAGGSLERNPDRSAGHVLSFSAPLAQPNGKHMVTLFKNDPINLNGDAGFRKFDVKSIDDDDVDDNLETCGRAVGIQHLVEDKEPSGKPSQGITSNVTVSAWTPLQTLNDDSEVLFPVSASGCSCPTDTLENGDGAESIDFMVELDQRNTELHYRGEGSPRAQGSPLSELLPSAGVPECMTVAELRQAIVAMMSRKHELEEQSRSLRNLLDGEMEHSAGLRQEIDTLKKKVSEQEERYAAKTQALARENEVLKVQLKKYVGAVQMLKREGQAVEVLPNFWNVESELSPPEQKQVENNEELASSYERKLIEVAEMHGELIEFNERLHRALMAKEALVSQMRQELIDLRGPVYIRIKDDEWNIYRRYTEFRSLHQKLQSKYHQVRSFNFPPKKAIGNKDAKFVEERRKHLQNYLRNVMNKVIQTVPEFTANPKKETLSQLMPFFIDFQPTGEPASKSSHQRATPRFPRLSRSHQREPRNLEPQSGDL